MSKLSRRDFLKTAAAATAGLTATLTPIATAFAQDMDEETAVLVIWHWGPDPIETAPDGAEGQWFAWKRDHFNQINPDTPVELQIEAHGWDEELRTGLLAAIAGGTAPDVTLGEAFVLEFTTLGAFNEVAVDAAAFPFGTIAGALIEDKLYGVPAMSSTFALEINPSVLERAGLDPAFVPAKWSELLEASQTIYEAGGNGEEFFGYTNHGPSPGNYGAALRVMPYLNRLGLLMGNVEGTEASFNAENSAEAYDLLRSLFATSNPTYVYGEREAGVGGGVWSGEGAFVLSFGLDAQRSLDFGSETVFAPIPMPDEGGTAGNTVVGNIVYSPLKTGPNPELGVKWVEMLATEEAQRAIANVRGFWIPARRDVLEDPTVLDTPLYDGIREKNRLVADLLLEEETFPAPPFRSNGSRIWDTWNDMWATMLTTDADTQTLLDDLQSQAERLL